MEDRRRAWVTLGLALVIHPRLRRHFRPETVLSDGLIDQGAEALGEALFLRQGVGRAIFSDDFPELADKEIRESERAHAAIVTFEDGDYPARLRHLPDPPPFLYVKGKLPPAGAGAVAVVGSRRATVYGLSVASSLGQELGRRGVTVVSGLARGIDAAAHKGAIESGGVTVGVLGAGIDRVYPPEHRRLFDQVAACGALATEYPFGTPPLAYHFPIRNRIIAAMSDAVVVVEAARDSGSLITARLAAEELGLPVGAVPGPVTSRTSEGCNDLLFDGATPVRDAADVIGMLPADAAGRVHGQPATEERACGDPPGDEIGPADAGSAVARVLEALSIDTPRGADELSEAVGLASGALLGHLLELEMSGQVARLPGGRYVRKR